MAGPAPTTLTNHEDRSAGPVHSSGWLSRPLFVRRDHFKTAKDILPLRYHRRTANAANDSQHQCPHEDSMWNVIAGDRQTDRHAEASEQRDSDAENAQEQATH